MIKTIINEHNNIVQFIETNFTLIILIQISLVITKIMSEMFKHNDIMECPVCFELMNENGNFAVNTPCQHSFCFKCITKSMNTNHVCPLCRSVLINEPNQTTDDDSDDDTEYLTDDDDSDDEEENEEINRRHDVETLAEVLKNKGYTMTDLLTLILEDTHKRTNVTKTVDDLAEEIYETIEELDNEKNENIMMAEEDNRIIIVTKIADVCCDV